MTPLELLSSLSFERLSDYLGAITCRLIFDILTLSGTAKINAARRVCKQVTQFVGSRVSYTSRNPGLGLFNDRQQRQTLAGRHDDDAGFLDRDRE